MIIAGDRQPVALFVEGVWLTVQLTGLSLIVGFCIALPFGIARARKVNPPMPLLFLCCHIITRTLLITGHNTQGRQ